MDQCSGGWKEDFQAWRFEIVWHNWLHVSLEALYYPHPIKRGKIQGTERLGVQTSRLQHQSGKEEGGRPDPRAGGVAGHTDRAPRGLQSQPLQAFCERPPWPQGMVWALPKHMLWEECSVGIIGLRRDWNLLSLRPARWFWETGVQA